MKRSPLKSAVQIASQSEPSLPSNAAPRARWPFLLIFTAGLFLIGYIEGQYRSYKETRKIVEQGQRLNLVMSNAFVLQVTILHLRARQEQLEQEVVALSRRPGSWQ